MTNSLAKFSLLIALLAFGAARVPTAQGAPSSANAQDVILDGFTMPSGNIACLYSKDSGRTTLRCDIEEMAVPPPQPSSCRFQWGHAFEMEVKGPAEPICTDDHTFDPGLQDLPYGQVWQRDGFTCRSEQSGVTCFNADQHGFSLSRAHQRVF